MSVIVLHVILLSVIMRKIIVLSVIILSVILLGVTALLKNDTKNLNYFIFHRYWPPIDKMDFNRKNFKGPFIFY
jgi:hypothetical protein